MRAIEVFKCSDGELTKAYYARLLGKWRVGPIAMNLFRAQKCSDRAKVYRGGIRGYGSYKSMAYGRKAYAMEELCKALTEHADLGITFGWKLDSTVPLHGRASWVLYIDLPVGQVSFHSAIRYVGPDYAGEWDGQHMSQYRIILFCDAVMDGWVYDILDKIELTGETKGHGVQTAMSANGMYESDRSEAPAAEVLLGCMPTKRRAGIAPEQTSFDLSPL